MNPTNSWPSDWVSHHGGRKLLDYLRQHEGLKVDQLKLKNPPDKIAQLYPGANSPVSVAVQMLLDDEHWVYARHFHALCRPFTQNRSCSDVPRLEKAFKRFVHRILFKVDWADKKSQKHPKLQEKTPEQAETHEVEEVYQRIDHCVNRWAEKFEELIPLVAEYVAALGESYNDPQAEGWSDYDDGDGEWSTKVADESDRIPRKYLDMLGRILAIFYEKTNILDHRLDTKYPKAKYNTPIKDQLDVILESTIWIKNLSWEFFQKYWYDKRSLQSRIEWIIHLINTIQAWLK